MAPSSAQSGCTRAAIALLRKNRKNFRKDVDMARPLRAWRAGAAMAAMPAKRTLPGQWQ